MRKSKSKLLDELLPMNSPSTDDLTGCANAWAAWPALCECSWYIPSSSDQYPARKCILERRIFSSLRPTRVPFHTRTPSSRISCRREKRRRSSGRRCHFFFVAVRSVREQLTEFLRDLTICKKCHYSGFEFSWSKFFCDRQPANGTPGHVGVRHRLPAPVSKILELLPA